MKRSVLSLILLIFLTQPIIALAQAKTDSITGAWEVVKATPFGVELEVTVNDGRKLKGKLLSVSDLCLKLSRKNEITELGRDEVLKVYQLSPKSDEFKKLLKGTGAGIGAGIGLVIGISTARGSGYRGPSSSILLIPVFSSALGAIGGYLIGDRMRSRLLLYDAGQRQQVAPNRPEPKKP
jgi:hypothetical protein